MGCFTAQRKSCHYACSHILEDRSRRHDLTKSAALTCGSLNLGKRYVRDFCKESIPLSDWALCSWQKAVTRDWFTFRPTAFATPCPTNDVFPNMSSWKNTFSGWIMFVPFKMYLPLQIRFIKMSFLGGVKYLKSVFCNLIKKNNLIGMLASLLPTNKIGT